MRIRRTTEPTAAAQDGEDEQQAIELRSELDELLRARQYAGQRERRLTEAVRAVPERQYPDPELLRQLAQARTLREGLGARCLELSEQLQALEDRLRQPAPRRPAPGQSVPRQSVPGQSVPGQSDTPLPGPQRPDPQRPEQHPGPRHSMPRQPMGARFDDAHAPATPSAPPSAPIPPTPPPPPEPPRRRSPAELTALAERITALHRRGATEESADLVAQAAVLLPPPDTTRLAGLLARGGPPGASVRLARGAARGTPEQAVGTLAELRQAGLAEEAAELFHALWSYPADALPALLAALERAGQLADGATLLWEWGSAPTAEVAALAAALQGSGRSADARTLLRQAAGRPTADLAALAVSLAGPLPAVLLRELAAARPPGELVRLAAALDGRPELYGELLAALTADVDRHRTTLAALRTAGLPTTPAEPRRFRWGRRHG
ncbi:hypothetical protein [Kitasatospora sp. NPDC087315]|uniref:hypothetical protein n=1 Tax=Kitasatospora sp. NPDC087315 TaxID=3364069 RepID=UPI003802134D